MDDAEIEPTPQRPVFEIEDLATLEVLINPLRLRIVVLVVKSALTVKAIAAELGVPVTRLYYHVNMLAKAGLIEVAETEKVGAMIQRKFRAVAARYSPADSLSRTIESDRHAAELVTAMVLEGARVDAEAMLARARENPDQPDAGGIMGRTFLRVAPDRLEYWISRMTEVIEEIEKEGEQSNDELYSFTFVLAPLTSPLRGGTA